MIAESAPRQRLRVASWVAQQLTRGAKVLYLGRPTMNGDADAHWILDPAGPAGLAPAITDGRFEFHDLSAVEDCTAGSTPYLFALLSGLCDRAVRHGWSSIAITRESPQWRMAGDAEAVHFAAQDQVFDKLSNIWPVRTACQLTLSVENPATVAESVAVHHGGLSDVGWSASYDGRYWRLRGVFDARVARRFRSALLGALRSARSKSDRNLYVDMSAIQSIDFSCMQIVINSGRWVGRNQYIVLRGADSFLCELVADFRSRALLFEKEIDGTLDLHPRRTDDF